MARAEMAALILRVRKLVGDSPAPQQFTDDDLQAALDQTVVHHNNEVLRYTYHLGANGVLTYQDYYSNSEYWDTAAALRWTNGQVLTPSGTTDYMAGYFNFPAGQYPVVIIDGRTYDVYLAAAEILTEWAALVKLHYNFQTVERQKFDAHQKFLALTALEAIYRKKAKPQKMRMLRLDINARRR